LNGSSLSGNANLILAAGRTATLNLSSTSNYSGVISGTGSHLIKSGFGDLTLTGANTLTGTTTVSSGMLTLNRTGGSTLPDVANLVVSADINASPGTLNFASDQIINNLSIANNAMCTLNPSKKLTINGVLTNNGTFNINSGSTLVQGSSSTLAGSGNYDIQQNITGSGGITPNGRFWYLGSPLSNSSSSALLSYTGDLVWQWNESSFAYAPVTSGQLTQGKSYVLRSGQSTGVMHFLGTGLSNGNVTISGLTRTGTTQTYRGCHLVSNPYSSYLDWDMVGKTQVSTTMYVRTASNSSIDVLETYNSANGQGTSISGPAMTKYIAPMQGFWVKVETDGQTGSLSMDNSMRSHQASGAGLRSTPQDFPAYLRFNMIDGENKDQVILLMSPDASMSLDNFDSEKMSASGYAQFYSTVNAKKLVINGMKNVKAKTSVPLTLVMPTSKSYTFQAEEFNIEDGLILLEDKQEGVIQDLTVNPTYSFFGNAGTNATRFVIHFQLATAPVLVGGPQELESLGSDELMTDNIQIVSNNQGTVIVRLDEGFKPEGSIRIFDASGRLVEQRDFNDQETTIQLNEQAGMYFVEVNAGKLMVKKKIVIE
jgi:autotransporter-associated beta strand protein